MKTDDWEVHLFADQVEVGYRDERYSVRDNGAVLRHGRPGRQLRGQDAGWTFGRADPKTGYLFLGAARIHQIVATAFHGPGPSSDHVVDHIDTNRHNNRPANLRWLTRLENIFVNPVTVRKIVAVYGSVEAMLARSDRGGVPGLEWMGRVTASEMSGAVERAMAIAGTMGARSIEQMAVLRARTPEAVDERTPMIGPNMPWPLMAGMTEVQSLTPWARQYDWKIPVEFPLCPRPGPGWQSEYLAAAGVGAVFTVGEFYGRRRETMVEVALPRRAGDGLVVVSEMSDRAFGGRYGWCAIGAVSEHICHVASGASTDRDMALCEAYWLAGWQYVFDARSSNGGWY